METPLLTSNYNLKCYGGLVSKCSFNKLNPQYC